MRLISKSTIAVSLLLVLKHHVQAFSTSSSRSSSSCTTTSRSLTFCKRRFSRTALHATNNDKNQQQQQQQQRTCIKQFLTQRTIQTFMLLCSECRDPHTVQYLDDFGGTRDLLQFHGTGGLNITLFPQWDSYLSNLIDQNKERITIQVKRRGAGTGGWSKNNPYLQPRFVEYHIDVDPLSLVQRMLTIREQLASEIILDLNVVIQCGDAIMDSYMDNIKSQTTNITTSSINTPDTVHSPKKYAFERTGPFYLRNQLAFREVASSALRGGTFDLLVLLATQEAIHRLLRNTHSSTNTHALRQIYMQHCSTYFDGSGQHGRADDFLELIMLQPPRISQSGVILDPLGLAEQLLHMRTQVAQDWKLLLESSAPIVTCDETGQVISTQGAPDHDPLRRKMHQRTTLLTELALSEVEDEELDNDYQSNQPSSSTSTSPIAAEKFDDLGEFQ